MKKTHEKILIGPFVQILTMDGLKPNGHLQDTDLQIIPKGGILVQDGKIREVGSYEAMLKAGHALFEIDFPAVATPGLIDAHTHVCYAGSRVSEYALRLQGKSYQDIMSQGGGILETVKQTRAASNEELELLLLKRAEKLALQGVTTCEVKSGYGLNVTDEVKMLRAIHEVSQKQPVELIPTCFGAQGKPPEFDSKTEYLSYLLQDLLVLVRKLNLAKRVDICVGKESFSVEQARPFIKGAQELGYSICVHADQFSRGGALLAAEMHTLSADHLEVSTDDDFIALKKNNVIPIVLPGATLGLGIPFPPAKKILDHDLPLVIASDWNPGSAPMGNLLIQAALLGMAEHLTMAETLAAMTIRAACALELNDRGVLKFGMRADIIAFPCSDYREILYNQGSLSPINISCNYCLR